MRAHGELWHARTQRVVACTQGCGMHGGLCHARRVVACTQGCGIRASTWRAVACAHTEGCAMHAHRGLSRARRFVPCTHIEGCVVQGGLWHARRVVPCKEGCGMHGGLCHARTVVPYEQGRGRHQPCRTSQQCVRCNQLQALESDERTVVSQAEGGMSYRWSTSLEAAAGLRRIYFVFFWENTHTRKHGHTRMAHKEREHVQARVRQVGGERENTCCCMAVCDCVCGTLCVGLSVCMLGLLFAHAHLHR